MRPERSTSIAYQHLMMIDEMEGMKILTLDVTVGVYLLAVGVNIDLRTGPGAVEEDLDSHVG